MSGRPKERLAKDSRLPNDALELYFFNPKVWFPLTFDDLEATVATLEEPTVNLAEGDIAGFANLYGCEFGTVCRIGHVSSSPQNTADVERPAGWFGV